MYHFDTKVITAFGSLKKKYHIGTENLKPIAYDYRYRNY